MVQIKKEMAAQVSCCCKQGIEEDDVEDGDVLGLGFSLLLVLGVLSLII